MRGQTTDDPDDVERHRPRGGNVAGDRDPRSRFAIGVSLTAPKDHGIRQSGFAVVPAPSAYVSASNGASRDVRGLPTVSRLAGESPSVTGQTSMTQGPSRHHGSIIAMTSSPNGFTPGPAPSA